MENKNGIVLALIVSEQLILIFLQSHPTKIVLFNLL